MATVNQVGNSLTGSTGTGAFVGATSPTIATPVIDQINDAAALPVLDFIGVASAVNYIQVSNRATTQLPYFAAAGSDAVVGLAFGAKNSDVLFFDSTATDAPYLIMRNSANTFGVGIRAAPALGVDVFFQMPSADGVANSTMISDGSGVLSFLATDPVIQRVSTINVTSTTGTTTVPFDNTIPQNTEGDQYMTLSITPKNTNNILVIEASLPAANTAVGGSEMCMALFQDTTAGALACTASIVIANQQVNTHLRYVMTAGTTSSTTFKIRAGSNSAGTTTTNGVSGGRIYGGVQCGSIIITEYTT